MSLTDEERDRLADVVRLQPTKNAELEEQWGMESGSEVYQYLRSELDAYYYRNDDNLICATPKAERLVGDDVEVDDRVVSGTPLEAQTVDALPDVGEEPQSVVATLQALRETGVDPEVDDVRSALNRLADRGVVERVRKTVPTFRLALDREKLTVEEEDSS